MKNFLPVLIILFSYSCSAQKNKDLFLERFKLINYFPSNYTIDDCQLGKNDTISKEDLISKLLIEINDINTSSSYNDNKYYFGSRFKLNSNHYLFTYANFYDFNESKLVICVYDCNKRSITSKLIVWETHPVTRSYTYQNGVFRVKSIYRKPNGLDPPPGKEYILKENIMRCRINENFCFEEIKK